MGSQASGHILFKDDYCQIYDITWDTISSDLGDLIDMTTIVMQPYVWNEEDQGFIKDRTVFRRGICTTIRQVIAEDDDGFTILSEGIAQIICVFRTSFACVEKPFDPFAFHLDSDVCDDIVFVIDCGPRWADPEEENDECVEWLDIADTSGDVFLDPNIQPFEWVNVWGNDEILTSNCDPTCDVTGT